MTRILLTMLLLLQGTALTQTRTITGRILQQDGSPASGLRVAALDDPDPGGKSLPPAIAAVAETDVAGRYALADLPPGRYRVFAGALRLPTYFPGVMERKDAAIVVVTREKGAEAVDFRLVPDAERIGPLLASKDNGDVAWGGWLAGESGNGAWTNVLKDELAEQLANGARDANTDVAIDTVTDALIRLNAKLPVSMLESLYARRPDEALVLMSRTGPEINAMLLLVVRRSSGVKWAAAANLLLANHAPGLAAHLLRGLSLEGQLKVCEPPGDNCRFAPQPVSLGSIGDGPPPFPDPSRPPWPAYNLMRGGDLLAKGPIGISYTRQVFQDGRSPRPNSFREETFPTNDDRLHYIAAVAPGVAVNLIAHEERTLATSDPDAIAAAKESFGRDIRSRYAALLAQLQAGGVLTAEEAAEAGIATPSLSIFVVNSTSTPRR